MGVSLKKIRMIVVRVRIVIIRYFGRAVVRTVLSDVCCSGLGLPND